MSDQAPGPPDGRSQRERMLAGELYIADDPQLAADNLRALILTRQFNASDPADAQARLVLLRELLGSLGEGTEIRPPLYCDYGYQTHVGARTFINFGVVLLDVATITIGDDVLVGPNVQFLTPDPSGGGRGAPGQVGGRQAHQRWRQRVAGAGRWRGAGPMGTVLP